MRFLMGIVLGACAMGALPQAVHAGNAKILWDTTGVAHIYADADDAGFRAFGWAQMEVHGDRILELYGRARARSAEYWGSEGIASDELALRLDFPESAKRWLKSLTPAERRKLEAFVAGMNAYAAKHPETIAAPMRIVLPVRASDPLAHLYQVIHTHFMSSGNIETARRIVAADPERRPASNAYAIAPSRSASGHAMLVINPHLPWSDLYTWFETQLSLPSQSIYGVALIGVPFVGIGFSEAGGWTHTVNNYDGSDLYKLRLSEGGYMLDGAFRAFDVRTRKYKVRQPDGSLVERTLTIRRSAHGPVIAERDGSAFALRIAAIKSYGMLQQYWDMAAAPDIDRFEAAQKRLQMPFFNTIYANRAGHIYFLHGGVYPDRKMGDFDFWRGIVPGDRSSFIWSGTLGYDVLPHFRDPPGGFIQNANDPPWTTSEPPVLRPQDYPAFIGPREGMDFRPQHSMRQILSDTSITFDELVAMKQSTRLELADRILPQLLDAAAASTDPEVRAASAILAAWDRRTDADSKGALLFMAWADDFLKSGDAAFATRWRPDRPYDTPAGIADPGEALLKLKAAAEEVRKLHGRLDAPYGQGYRLRLGGLDLPGSGGPSEYGAYRNAFGIPGNDGVSTLIGGDSFAAVVEFGPRIKAVGIMPYGASSQSNSPYLGNQQSLFSAGKLRPIWFYPEDVRANLDHLEIMEK